MTKTRHTLLDTQYWRGVPRAAGGERMLLIYSTNITSHASNTKLVPLWNKINPTAMISPGLRHAFPSSLFSSSLSSIFVTFLCDFFSRIYSWGVVSAAHQRNEPPCEMIKALFMTTLLNKKIQLCTLVFFFFLHKTSIKTLYIYIYLNTYSA